MTLTIIVLTEGSLSIYVCLTLELQIADYVFVTAMAIELTVKILAEGLIFTPNALLQNMSGVFDVLIFSVNLVWLAWTPHQVRVIFCCYMVILIDNNLEYGAQV